MTLKGDLDDKVGTDLRHKAYISEFLDVGDGILNDVNRSQGTFTSGPAGDEMRRLGALLECEKPL